MRDKDFEILRALYDGEISYLDFRMGQLFDYLRELQVLDDTVLIITSDHGENFGEHHLMDHQFCVYDTLLHVPLIIRYPKLFQPGLRVTQQVQTTDIFPTILDIAGIEWDKGKIQRHSLLKQGDANEPTFAIAELSKWHWAVGELKGNPNFDAMKYDRRLKTIRTDSFKYIWASDGNHELYDIRNDSAEINNLIETQPEKAKELKTRLIEWLNSFEPAQPAIARQVK